MKRSMNVGALCVAGALALTGAAVCQQSSSSQTTTQSTTTTTTRPIQGRVVSYEAGKSIVVVTSEGREQTFPLTANVSVPSDVAVGRTVSIATEPGAAGNVVVSRITTTSVGPDGSMKTETQTHVTDPDANRSALNPSSDNNMSSWSSSAAPMSSGQSTTQSTTTQKTTTMSSDGTITGTVTAYEPGKTVTFVLPDQKSVVYTIDATSVVPSDIAVGKTYTVTTVKSTSGGDKMVVKKITTTTTTKSNP